MPSANAYKNLSEEALLERYKNSGDSEWLGILLEQYTAMLLGVAMKYLKDRMQAEDAVQQVFLKVLTHMPEEGILNFKGWLYVLMRNYCLQQIRDKTHIADENAMANVISSETNIEELRKEEQVLETMIDAIAQLPEEQRRTIDMFYLKKQSYADIMELTGYSFVQVKSYIQNGKRNLKNILSKLRG